MRSASFVCKYGFFIVRIRFRRTNPLLLNRYWRPLACRTEYRGEFPYVWGQKTTKPVGRCGEGNVLDSCNTFANGRSSSDIAYLPNAKRREPIARCEPAATALGVSRDAHNAVVNVVLIRNA